MCSNDSWEGTFARFTCRCHRHLTCFIPHIHISIITHWSCYIILHGNINVPLVPLKVVSKHFRGGGEIPVASPQKSFSFCDRRRRTQRGKGILQRHCVIQRGCYRVHCGDRSPGMSHGFSFPMVLFRGSDETIPILIPPRVPPHHIDYK